MLAETSSFLAQEVVSQVMSLSVDVIVLISIFFSLFAYALYAGKSKSVGSLLSLLVVGFLFFVFPFWDEIIPGDFSKENEMLVKLGSFVAAFLLIRLFLAEIMYTHYPDGRIEKLLQAAFLSVFFGTFLLMLLYQLFSFELFYMFSPPFRGIFLDPQWFFIVLTISIFGLYFVKKSE